MWRAGPIILAAALMAAACSGGDDPGVIERRATGDDDTGAQAAADRQVCVDVEAFALGAFAGSEFDATFDELARLAALLGATEALPHLGDVGSAYAASEPVAYSMDAAAEILDRVSFDECQIPVFTAMYVSTSFASCFGRAPIAAGSMTPDTAGCETGIEPAYLPCFDETRGHIPVDCRDDEPVVLRGGEWVES